MVTSPLMLKSGGYWLVKVDSYEKVPDRQKNDVLLNRL